MGMVDLLLAGETSGVIILEAKMVNPFMIRVHSENIFCNSDTYVNYLEIKQEFQLYLKKESL